MSPLVRRESHHRRAYRFAVTLVGANFSQLPSGLAATVAIRAVCGSVSARLSNSVAIPKVFSGRGWAVIRVTRNAANRGWTDGGEMRSKNEELW